MEALLMEARAVDAFSDSLTMTVAEYCAVSGEGEHAVREDVRLNKIPHVLSGRRGLIKILKRPALARLGLLAD
jgi:hypothetical protein